jgi:hypothetical protein
MAEILSTLTRQARALGLTDSEWAGRAGVRKETLSRVRSRQTSDFETLCSLAHAVGARLGVLDMRRPDSTSDGHFPAHVDRDYEEQLVALCASGSLERVRWASAGPYFFMAGLAVMLAGVQGQDRRGLLALAEQLHPGAIEPAVFTRWLADSPVRPARFLPLVEQRGARAA